MKIALTILLAFTALVACKDSDNKKTGAQLTPGEMSQSLNDTVNYTSIEWIDSTHQDLGKVKEGTIVEVNYHFRNSGTKPLIVADVTAGCGCTIPEKPVEPIAPGKEEIIKAKFNSKGQHQGEHIKNIMVISNSNPRPAILTFRVEVTQ
jgi:hypothetical protein